MAIRIIVTNGALMGVIDFILRDLISIMIRIIYLVSFLLLGCGMEPSSVGEKKS